ncbi:MAG: heme exporter protein CcmD [Amaricoccus sp.]|uniref:heme exporter protein CcmD n=1 Tax=Amaricoccus sp. TaxID=1872485 RepID=UPI00331605BA
MPDLAQYAGTVLGAYGVTLALIALLIGASLRRARRVARALKAAESLGKEPL